MNGTELYVKNASFFVSHSPKRSAVNVKGRDHHSLTLRLLGKITVKSHGKKLTSSKGSITFVPKKTAYTTEILEDVHTIVIHFDTMGGTLPSEPTVIEPNDHSLASLFNSLVQDTKSKNAHLKKMAVLYEILAEFERLVVMKENKVIPKKISEAKSIIDKSFSDPYFSIEGLAEKLDISSSFLRREYRAAYGTSPMKHLKETRLAKAKELLLTDKYTVSKIAELCGYTGISYFIQDFHKFVGKSPSQYRKHMWLTP